MNIVNFISVVISILFFVQMTFAENPCNVMIPNGDESGWGIGGYFMPEKYNIQVYSESTAEVYGTLSASSSFLRLTLVTGEYYNLNIRDLAFVGNQQNELLKVRECFNPDFVRILWNSSKQELYISKEEASKEGATFITYLDALIDFALKPEKPKQYKIGVNLKRNCINIRTQPNSESKKLLCALGNDWDKPYETILELKEINKNWVKVIYYELHPSKDYPTNDEDCFSIKKNQKSGWLKAVDDNGFPNIWFAVTGY